MAGLWQIVVPTATTNLITNPSFEAGLAGSATGWTAIAGSRAVVSTSPVFGTRCLRVTPTAATGDGVYFGTVALTAGTTYVASIYCKGQTGIPYKMYFGDTSANVKGTPVEFVGDGAWHRYEVAWACDASASYRLYVTKNNSANTGYLYLDGAQVEARATATTYCDGSLAAPIGFSSAGCAWSGTSHASTSTRTATSRAGGLVTNFDDLYFYVTSLSGAGAPSVKNYFTEYALLDGAQHEHTRVSVRTFILNGLIVGTSLSNLHTRRATLYSRLQPANNEPVLLRYLGGAGVAEISAYYDGGLEGGVREGFNERISIRFYAPSPNWREVIV